jgi:hypothetical protein
MLGPALAKTFPATRYDICQQSVQPKFSLLCRARDTKTEGIYIGSGASAQFVTGRARRVPKIILSNLVTG